MPVTTPSVEFVGLLNDAIPFALDDDDFPDLNCLRIAWDGELLHTQAHDNQHAAWSRWSPEDDPTEGDVQESFLEPFGSDDEPWERVITLEDAKTLAKAFKPDKKRLFVPLHLDASAPDCLKVVRNRVPGLPATTITVDHQDITYADLAGELAKHDRADAVRSLAFTAAHLGHFATVRPRGPLEMTFTGQRGPAIVNIGERFTGLITPVRPAADRHLQSVA